MMRRTAYWLFLPAIGLLVPFLVVPLLSVLAASFGLGATLGGDSGPTLSHYALVLGDPYYLKAFIRTIALGGGIAILAAALGLPLAWFMVRHPAWRTPLILLLTGPLLVNVIARLYGWQMVLADSGPLNKAIAAVFGNTEPIFFTGTMTGVVIVMVHVFLPYMTMSLYNAMQTIPASVIEAARTLGASGWKIFWRIAVPLAVPGLITGAIIVFSLASSSFVIPAIMGGGKVNTFPTLVYQEAMTLNFARAAALAGCLLIVLVPLSRLSGRLNQVAS